MIYVHVWWSFCRRSVTDSKFWKNVALSALCFPCSFFTRIRRGTESKVDSKQCSSKQWCWCHKTHLHTQSRTMRVIKPINVVEWDQGAQNMEERVRAGVVCVCCICCCIFESIHLRWVWSRKRTKSKIACNQAHESGRPGKWMFVFVVCALLTFVFVIVPLSFSVCLSDFSGCDGCKSKSKSSPNCESEDLDCCGARKRYGTINTP